TWRPGLAIIYAELGLKEEARAELEMLAADRFTSVTRDGSWMTTIAYLAEVCAFLHDTERAKIVYDFLAPYGGRNVVASPNVACYGSADRYLGLLAATLERWADAIRHFEAALASNERQHAWPWVAHTQHDYAAALMARGNRDDRARALELALAALARG